MEKIKQLSLKAMLLTFLAATLTFGFSSCTEEIGSDTTTGKPGYLTISLKTLKINQSKTSGTGIWSDGTTPYSDYTKINDINIFVVDGETILTHKYVAYSSPKHSSTDISLPVNTLNTANAKVIAVANYGSDMGELAIQTVAELKDTPIATVSTNDKNLSTKGLHMTGQADITTITGGGGYESQVKIAPVEAKITVNWELSSFISYNYDVTGIFVVNAINTTTLPIILEAGINNTNISKINNIETVRTASTGLDAVDGKNYNFYGGMTNTKYLRDIKSDGSALDAGPYHYYVGENYSTTAKPASGFIFNTLYNYTTNANTIVVIRVTNKHNTSIHKYYTYELNSSSHIINNPVPAIAGITAGITEGFSVRRKTNYSLTFKINSLGTVNPFERLESHNLAVTVTADAWDPAGVNPTF